MGGETEPLTGFSWDSGTKRVTAGIALWSDFFLHTKSDGEKVAVVIVDTQGLFDNRTTPFQNTSIFALTTILSSIEILNLSQQIQEDHLHYLMFATEYARFAKRDEDSQKPFQKLLFLIRDWSSDEEYKFGVEGGKRYLEYALTVDATQNEELKSVRTFIQQTFDDLQCSLLPFPGKLVTAKGNGSWILMDEDFRKVLKKFIEDLMKPENLIVKKIEGSKLNGSQTKECIKRFFTHFQSDKIPDAPTLYSSSTEQQLNVLRENCLMKYKSFIDPIKFSLTNEEIASTHEKYKNEVLLFFMNEKKMGNQNQWNKHSKILEEEITKAYKNWKDPLLMILKSKRDDINKDISDRKRQLLSSTRSKPECSVM